jgi:hypothetical protein
MMHELPTIRGLWMTKLLSVFIDRPPVLRYNPAQDKGPIGSDDRLIEAELGRMVTVDELFMEVVCIGIQHRLALLDPAVENALQIRPLNLLHNRRNPVKDIRRPGELLLCPCDVM